MGIAGQHDEVGDPVVADGAQDLGPLGRVAVPLVEVEELARCRVQQVLAEHHLVRPIFQVAFKRVTVSTNQTFCSVPSMVRAGWVRSVQPVVS